MAADRPNTIPWPPLIYVAAAALGLVLHVLLPLPWVSAAPATALMMLGILLICVALALELATALTFSAHRTTILPHRAATRLITSGPFAWSRNPIYLANTLLVLGAGLAFAIAWLLPAAVAAAWLTRHLAILREERHLATTFGEEWTNYQRRTHRWFGRKS